MFSNMELVRFCGRYGPCTDFDHSTLYVAGNHGVCANPSVRTDLDRTQDLGTGSDVDVARNFRKAAGVSYSDGDLLEDQAIYANLRAWMNDYPVGVGNQQATTDLTIEWNICARDDAPERMPHNKCLAEKPTDQSPSLLPGLITPDRAQ
jgi:hypothetical protein